MWIKVYRVDKTQHAGDLSGEGARLNGGRWNHRLIPCVYTSESRALAILEYAVNRPLKLIPRALSISEIHIPGGGVLYLEERSLPGDWRSLNVPVSTKDFLKPYFVDNNIMVIRVPSAIVSGEYNYVLNPRHVMFSKCRVETVSDFSFDVRIK